MWIKSFFTLLLLFSSIAQAQIISGYGIKFGAVSSKQIFEQGVSPSLDWNSYLDMNWNRRLGPQITLYVQFLNARHFTLEGELCYLEKGTDVTIYRTLVDSDGNYVDGEPFRAEFYQFDYLAFSVFARPKISAGQIEPYVLIGPSLNILISNKELFFKEADIVTPSVVIGSGIEFKKLFDFPFCIEIRYGADLNCFFENENLKSKFEIWQLFLGAKLNR